MSFRNALSRTAPSNGWSGEVNDRLESVGEMHREIKAMLQEGRRPQYPAKRIVDKITRPYVSQASEAARGGFRSFGHFCKAVKEHGHNPHGHRELGNYVTKILPTGLGETGGADGGFLIPPEFSNQLLQRMYDNDLLSRTMLFPMTSGFQLKIPAINETSRADGSRFGGVQGFWRGEAGTITESKPNFAQITLSLNTCTIAIRITDEMLADSGMAVETYLDTVASEELTFKIGDGLVNGSGVDMPQGLMNSPSKVALPDPTGLAGSINSTQVMKMWSRLHVSCRANAVWLIDQSLEPALMAMTVGTSSWPIYLPAGGLSAVPYATLFGKPALVTEFGATAGTEGDIILTDLSTMCTATKAGIESGVSIHLYWLSAEQSFRFIIRMDGRNWWLAALTPKSGGSTQSNIVTQATRS